MPPHKLSDTVGWRDRHADMVISAAQAVAKIRPGQRVFIGSGCAQPEALVRALTARSRELADTEIVHLLTVGAAPYATRELAQHFRVNSFFIGQNVRDVIQEGLGDYTPIMLSDIPRLLQSGQCPIDVALIQVTPPDEHGYCNLGISVDIVKAAAENAGLVVAQVNAYMPRTRGNSSLHVYDLDHLVAHDQPLPEIHPPEPTETTRRIGEYVAALIDDGATLEIGIGRVPQSVLEALRGKHDLGVHTEMFTDKLLDLILSGAVSGRRKTVDQGKIVASFCMGTSRLYEFIHDNPLFSFQPTDYVNDPFRISRQHAMVAVNVALEIDLTGQVCADSLGPQFFSGIGGQVDFNRGAARSRQGKAIIAMPSTARGNQVSRIVAQLSPGAGVVTTRGDVHYVVTEYGVAYLHGLSVEDRALALISIAHPDFRRDLLTRAIELHYVRPAFGEMSGPILAGPRELRTSHLLDDGTRVNMRPIHPTDIDRVKSLFYQLSRESIYLRFMTRLRHIQEKQVQEMVYVDHRKEVVIVGTLAEASGEEIIALSGYYLDPRTNRAEVAFLVRDDWQGRGLTTFLLKYLAGIACRNGIAGFTAETLLENRAMQAVFNHSGFKVESRVEGDVVSFTIGFAGA